MSTLTTTEAKRLDVLHPIVAAATGAAVFGLAMTAGEVFDLNADGEASAGVTWGEFAGYVGLVLVGGLIAVWLGLRARAGSPDRLARTALGLAVASAVFFVGFWSGWPHMFGAVAVVLALEHRRRVGSFGGMTISALLIGALAVAASTVTCVLG